MSVYASIVASAVGNKRNAAKAFATRYLKSTGIQNALTTEEFKEAMAKMMSKVVNPTVKTAIQSKKMEISFSGGPDSLALLSLARRVYGKDKIIAIFVNHGLQAYGVTEDEKLVENLFDQLDVNGEIYRMNWDDMNISSMAKGQMQEFLREQRYKILLEACRTHDAQVLLTGHNLDDDVATMIYRT